MIFEERSETYVDVDDNLIFLKDGNSLLRTSELDGFKHIYKLSFDGKHSQITAGSWDVIDFLGLDLNHFLYREHIALLNNLYSEGVRIFPIIYDILPITSEEYFDDNIHKIHKMYFESSIMFGNIISMSKTTSDECKKLSEKVGNINFRKTKAYHCLLGGAGESNLFNKQLDKKVSKDIKLEIFNHCHIVVGTLEPRKGHKDIIDAFEEAWKKGSGEKLLIIGKIGWKIDKTLKKIYKNRQEHKPEKLVNNPCAFVPNPFFQSLFSCNSA